MTNTRIAWVAAIGLALAGSPLVAQSTPPEITIQETPTGPVFADVGGYTLYVTERDEEPSVSTCFGPCASEWPPLRASADATPFGEWTLVPRDDGLPQWAYRRVLTYRKRPVGSLVSLRRQAASWPTGMG